MQETIVCFSLKVVAIVDNEVESSICKSKKSTLETKLTDILYLPYDVLDQALSRCTSFITKVNSKLF